VYNDARKTLESLTVNGQPVKDEGRYTICLQEYHYKVSDRNIGLTNEALTAIEESRLVTTSACDVIEEYLRAHQNLGGRVEGRLMYKTVS
jgi:5'-nucleotidase